MPRQLPTKETIEQVLNYAKSLSNEDVYAYIQSIHDWFVQLANVATNHEETLKSIRELFPALQTWQDLEKVRAQYNADMLSFIANKYYSKLQLFPEKNNILVNSFNELQQTIQFLKDLNSIREDCLEKLNQQRNVQTHRNNEPTVLQSNRTTGSLDESQSNTSTSTSTSTSTTTTQPTQSVAIDDRIDEEDAERITPKRRKKRKADEENLKQPPKKKSKQGSLEELKSKLTDFNYTEAQVLKITKRKYCTNTVIALIQLHPSLLEHGFSHEQLVRIAAHDGGSKNLEAVKNNFQALKDLGFTPDHIVKMVGHGGGSKNLEAVKTNFQALKNLDFTPDHIVKMVGHIGGSKNLEAVKTNFQALKDLGFTPDHIVKMVGHIGGSKNLEAVKNNFHALKDLGFTPDHIVKMVGHIGGSKNLEAVKNNFHALKDLDFTPDHIVKMVGHGGGSNNLEAVKNNFQALKDLGFTPDHIVKMVQHNGGSKNLEAVKNNFQALKDLGFTPDHIVNMVGHDGGSKNLEAVKTNFQALKDLGFTPDHIVKMVGHNGGSKNLEAVKTNFQALKDLGFTPDHIVKMVQHDGGSKNLEAVKTNFQALKDLGFTPDHIVKMVGHIGGSKNLEAVKTNFQALKDLGFTPDHIVKMVGHDGGSKNLEAVKTNFQALKDLGFTPDHIVKMVGHDGGSKNLEAVKECYNQLKISGLKRSEITNYFSERSRGRDLLRRSLELSSKPLSAWELLFETEKVNTFFQRVNNIGTVIIHKKWATSIASDNGKIIFEVKETYLASQINAFLTRCYKNNTAMRTWCHPPSLSSAEKVSIQLINPSHFISNEQILDTISFLVYLVKYNLKANSSSFLQQLTYTCSNTSSLAALISFDDLCAKFTTEYQHIPLNSMKSFLADFCIGLVNKQFEELNKEAEEKYDSFVLSKLDGRVYIDNYGPFNDFYAEVMLPELDNDAFPAATLPASAMSIPASTEIPTSNSMSSTTMTTTSTPVTTKSGVIPTNVDLEENLARSHTAASLFAEEINSPQGINFFDEDIGFDDIFSNLGFFNDFQSSDMTWNATDAMPSSTPATDDVIKEHSVEPFIQQDKQEELLIPKPSSNLPRITQRSPAFFAENQPPNFILSRGSNVSSNTDIKQNDTPQLT